jgi:hypothetical protein
MNTVGNPTRLVSPCREKKISLIRKVPETEDCMGSNGGAEEMAVCYSRSENKESTPHFSEGLPRLSRLSSVG